MNRNLLKNLAQVPPGGFRYIQPETNFLISAPNFRELIARICQHRRINKLPIGTDLDAEVQDWICAHVEDPDIHCRNQDRAATERRASRQRNSGVGTGWDGSAKWRELHIYALTQRPAPPQRMAWLGTFAASLPCGECRREWRKLTKEHKLPMDASAPEFFAWTVRLHNMVNSRLGKAEISEQDARTIWS